MKSIKIEVYHQFSGLCFIAEVNFWRPPKTVVSCDLFIIIIIIIFINFFRLVFSECTEANTTALVPLDTSLPGICAFIICVSCTVHGQSYVSIRHTLLNCTQYLDTYH